MAPLMNVVPASARKCITSTSIDIDKEVAQVMHAAERELSGREHLVPSAPVFEIGGKSRLSAYDCELIVLASILDVPLVTADKAVLKACPDLALTMEAFLRTDEGS